MRFLPSLATHLSVLGLAALLPSCALFRREPPPKASHVMYEWDDDGGPGEIAVEIDLSSQTATYKRGGRPVGWSFVSTGKEGKSTTPGRYRITEMMELKHSNRYGWITGPDGQVSDGDARPTTPVPDGHTYHPAPMAQWMRLTSYGIGMHAGNIPNPGEPASHGCIRLPRDFAPVLYAQVKVGTPVTIVKSGAPKRPVPRQLADTGGRRTVDGGG